MNLLKIANNDLPRVESVIERLRFVLTSLESEKQTIEQQIFDLHRTLYEYRAAFQEETAKINRLRQKRIELEQLISRFESGDEKYLGIKNTIKQEVESEVAIIDNYWTLL